MLDEDECAGVQLPTAAICNGWVTCKYKVLSSLLRLVTVDRYVFKSQPLQIAKRYAQCRADRVVAHRALAHLLAAHSIPTPKQAKEPTFPPATKDELITDN